MSLTLSIDAAGHQLLNIEFKCKKYCFYVNQNLKLAKACVMRLKNSLTGLLIR